MADRLIIVGDRVFAEIAYEYFTHDSPYEVVGFAVEARYRKRDELLGLPVLDFETLPESHDPETHAIHVALTYAQVNRVRARLAADAKRRGYRLAAHASRTGYGWRDGPLGG